jgi:hypothetical protein
LYVSARALLAGAAALVLLSPAARAATIVIDGSAGTVSDGIIDGFPFAFPFDGVPDAGGNALSVALKSGVTELRSIVEIPLSSLAGFDPGDIESATLTFNIDDVIATFGPGAAFDGTASETIFVWAWNGNGTVDLSDFNNVAGAPTATVNTGPHGSITDATLGTTGPLVYDVDVTAALQARLTAGATHMGVTMATNDDQSATSLDDLGLGGAGPPGVGGAAKPFLTVVTSEPEPPVFGDETRKCQKALDTHARVYANLLRVKLAVCFNRVLKDVGLGKPPGPAIALCDKHLDPTDANAPVTKARAKAIAKIGDACPGVLPGDLNAPCDGGAVTIGDTATCVLDAHAASAAVMMRATYADACAIATAVGLDTAFPDLCM